MLLILQEKCAYFASICVNMFLILQEKFVYFTKCFLPYEGCIFTNVRKVHFIVEKTSFYKRKTFFKSQEYCQKLVNCYTMSTCTVLILNTVKPPI